MMCTLFNVQTHDLNNFLRNQGIHYLSFFWLYWIGKTTTTTYISIIILAINFLISSHDTVIMLYSQILIKVHLPSAT